MADSSDSSQLAESESMHELRRGIVKQERTDVDEEPRG